MLKIAPIGLAGLPGTPGRYGVAAPVARRCGGEFPPGTLFVNVAASNLPGLLMVRAGQSAARLLLPAR